MEELLNELPVREEIRPAFLGAPNALRRVFEMVPLDEAGAWEELEIAAAAMNIAEDSVPGMLPETVDWTRNVRRGRPVGEVKLPALAQCPAWFAFRSAIQRFTRASKISSGSAP
jgi:hypothetical protein